MVFPLKLYHKNINPNNYLPYAIPGIEIVVSVIFITIVGSSILGNGKPKILNLNKFPPYEILCNEKQDRYG